MRIKGMIIILLCSILMVGCNRTFVEEKPEEQLSFSSMEEEPVLSYEVPMSTPGILVNQLGYIAASKKIVIFQGKEIPTYYRIIDAETGIAVYVGYPEDKEYNKLLGEYNSYGDFSDLKAPGTYYIEAPILGKSYTFTIEEAIYDSVFNEALKQYYYNRCGITLTKEYAGDAAHNACHTNKALLKDDISVSVDVAGGWHQDEKGQKDVEGAAKTIGMLLLSYELHEQVFTDNTGIPESGNGIPDILDEIRYEIEWLLKMQNQETGAVYAGVTVYTQSGNESGKAMDSYVESPSLEAQKAFAMALAKFSYIYQTYDTVYATNCLKAADRAWKYMELNDKEQLTDNWKFAAAAELYRASGRNEFQNYVLDYLLNTAYQEELDIVNLLGCVTYISTKHNVNVEQCEKVVKYLMAQAEEISMTAKKSVYLTAGNEMQDNNEQLLLEMAHLTVVNHIIANHEYETVIENHMHYFMGRNSMAISYVDQAGENSYQNFDSSLGIMKKFEEDSQFIFMLSGILESYEE